MKNGYYIELPLAWRQAKFDHDKEEKFMDDIIEVFEKYEIYCGGWLSFVEQETRDKMSKSNTGKKRTQETKDKVSKAKQNTSQITRDKMSIAQIKRWNKKSDNLK